MIIFIFKAFLFLIVLGVSLKIIGAILGIGLEILGDTVHPPTKEEI